MMQKIMASRREAMLHNQRNVQRNAQGGLGWPMPLNVSPLDVSPWSRPQSRQLSRPQSQQVSRPPSRQGPSPRGANTSSLSTMRALLRLGGLRMSRAAGLEREKWQHALRRIRSSQGLDTLGALNQQVESRRKFMDGMAQQREEAMQLQRQATRSLQHEPSMYSAASLERRYALRHEPRVVEELRLWWLAAQTLGPDARGLSPSEYQLILLLVYKAMIDEFSLAEATQAVHEDWLNDARGSALLSASGFMDCLFELADVWTSTTDAEEYSEFLHRLLLNVTFVDEQGTRRFKLQESVAAGSGQPNSLEEQLERGLSAQERQKRRREAAQKKRPLPPARAFAAARPHPLRPLRPMSPPRLPPQRPRTVGPIAPLCRPVSYGRLAELTHSASTSWIGREWAAVCRSGGLESRTRAESRIAFC
eukprot:Transcript_565.p1 GENE.Transcript_565~~Transcript_565.p1  ORF type:complete len:420 (-),score=99.09 Transcript_565:1448-2707(-)